MRFEIITIFPGFFAGIFEHGIVRRAQAEGLVTVGLHDLRDFTHDRHRTVDDRPFGGGEGMVLKPEPLAEALASLGVGKASQEVQARKQADRASARSRMTDSQDAGDSAFGAGAAVYAGGGAGVGQAGPRGADLRPL